MNKKVREIGSEFWDVPVSSNNNNLFNKDYKWFLCGTTALRYIVNDILAERSFEKVLIPSWCCDTIIRPFLEKNIKVDFYSVTFNNGNFNCDLDGINEYDVILIMDFFGFVGHSIIKNYQGIIIRDVTHSLFSYGTDDADYCFGSLRKWAGFYTGGFAFAKKWNSEILIPCPWNNYVLLREQAMNMKKDYIYGNISSKEYLNIFNECESILDNTIDIYGGIQRDTIFAKKLDIRLIRNKRRKNAKYLLKKLKKYAIFKKITKKDCPLFFPLYLPQNTRELLKRFLIDNNIYCPVHWPLTKYHTLNNREKEIYLSELSIVCDHRYGKKDMKKVAKLIINFLKKDGKDA